MGTATAVRPATRCRAEARRQAPAAGPGWRQGDSERCRLCAPARVKTGPSYVDGTVEDRDGGTTLVEGRGTKTGTMDRTVGSGMTVEELRAELPRLEMLAYTDPRAAASPAADAERVAERLGEAELRQRARLVLADVACRQGDVTGSGRIAQEIHQWAAEHGARILLSRTHRFLAAFFHRLGDTSGSMEHALSAVDLLDDGDPVLLRMDHLLLLGMALADARQYAPARDRFQAAGELVQSTEEYELQMAVLNNLASLELECGTAARAVEATEQMLALAARQHVRLDTAFLVTHAQALQTTGQLAAAERVLQSALEDIAASSADYAVEAMLVLARVQVERGRREQALQTAARCERLCVEHGYTGLLAQSLDQRASALAEAGPAPRGVRGPAAGDRSYRPGEQPRADSASGRPAGAVRDPGGPPGQDALPGAVRTGPADRSAQPAAPRAARPRPDRADAAAWRAARPGDHRRGPLQGVQRHVLPRRGRRGPACGR